MVVEVDVEDGAADGRIHCVAMGGLVLAVHVEEAVESEGLEGRFHQLPLLLLLLLAALPPVPCGGRDTKLGLLLEAPGRMV